ncbi:endo-1,4-beta-xylanase [Flavitalea antarctica]
MKVSQQSFAEAYEINTFNKVADKGNIGLSAQLSRALNKGDILWISFKARCLQSTRETGEAFVELRFDQLVNGAYKWPSHLERGVSIGSEWTETSIPFLIEKDVQPGDARLVIQFDTYAQRFQLGPVTFLRCSPGVNLADLPRTRIRYDGDAPDAPWRKTAAANIDKYRKGNLIIKVLDAKGKPVPNARVSVRMKRHAYSWGTATSSSRLLDTTDPGSEKYRDTLLKYFNQVVFENEMKWPRWAENRDKHQQTLKALQWTKDHNLPVRGHVMLWPSWEHLPKFLAGLKDDTAALRATIFGLIKNQTTTMKGHFAEWDVTNELYAHHDLLDILGRDEMLRWFDTAHAYAPDVRLFYNEYTMFHRTGPGSPADHFYNTVRYLKSKNAPLYGIGEQGHIGGTPPGIPLVIERLEKFADLGYPIQISEFDINSNDEEFKASYQRDFMTAVYSNPATIGFIQWGFWEGQHWFPVAALWNKDWTIRTNGKAYTDLVFKEWWTNSDGQTDIEGAYNLRGFCGEYEVTVTAGASRVTYAASISTKNANLTVHIKD